jgi:MoxR-like ATPase
MTPADLKPLRDHIASRIIGQQAFVDSMLICLLSDGHLLVEGMPGLAKTTAVKALAEALEGDFHRIQFTPDLLPSDLIGTDIYRHEKGEFEFRPGPLFHNVLLADEVNRAPAKVQSALLESMAEHQITVGQRTYPLPKLFIVLATLWNTGCSAREFNHESSRRAALAIVTAPAEAAAGGLAPTTFSAISGTSFRTSGNISVQNHKTAS